MMDVPSFSGDRSFSSQESSPVSSPISVSRTSTPSIESSFTLSSASTPATERSTLSEYSRRGSLSNETCSHEEFILVVGGLGYIGSHTSWELLRAGHNVIIIDNLCNSHGSVLDKLKFLRDSYHKAQASPLPMLDFYQANYRDQHFLRAIFSEYQHFRSPTSPESKITGVIHFAAYKAVAESFQKPLEYYANNVSGMVDFCSILSEFGIKTFVFSSSATVYGELANKGERLVEEQCDNTGCTGLTNPYGRTKWMCEAILNDLAVSDPTWIIIALRYFNPIGCDQSGTLGENPSNTPNNLMPIVIKAMTGESTALTIFGTDWDTPDGTAVRDFIHVSDLALGHLAALRAAKKPTLNGFHAFNLGTGTGCSVKNIVTAMEQASGTTIPTKLSKRREGDVGSCIAEPSKSAMILDWKAEKTLVESCYDICRYLNINTRNMSSLGSS